MKTLEEFVRSTPFFIIAHRGASGEAPENTIAAMKLALEGGALMVEIDIQTTADDEMVVFHDNVLGRTTDGSGKINNTSLDDLRKLDAGSWFDTKYKGELVPTLDEVLDVIDKQCYLNIEIKPIKDPKTAGKKIQHIINIVQDRGIAPYALLSSFDHRALHLISEIDPMIYTTALNVPGDTRLPSEIVAECGANGFGCSIHELTKKRSEDLRTHMIPWGVYSVDNEAQLHKALEYGVTSVVTKYPGIVSEAFDRIKGQYGY